MRKVLILTVAAALMMALGSASAGAPPAFMEDFEDGDVAGWTWQSGGFEGIIEAVATPVSPSGGNYVGKVTFGWSCHGPGYQFDLAAPDYISWRFRADGDTGNPSGVGALFWSSGGWLTKISYHLGNLRYYVGGYNQIMPASMGTWYLIELKNIDWDSDTFDIWVDGVEKVVGAAFYFSIDGVTGFATYACPRATGPIYLDDITFGYIETVPVDIKPGSDPNSINPKSNGLLPVGVFTTALFDATTIDVSTVTFGPNAQPAVRGNLADLDGDGDTDLILLFRTKTLGFDPSDTEACLNAETTSGTPVHGCDAVRVLSLPSRGGG